MHTRTAYITYDEMQQHVLRFKVEIVESTEKHAVSFVAHNASDTRERAGLARRSFEGALDCSGFAHYPCYHTGKRRHQRQSPRLFLALLHPHGKVASVLHSANLSVQMQRLSTQLIVTSQKFLRVLDWYGECQERLPSVMLTAITLMVTLMITATATAGTTATTATFSTYIKVLI